MDVWNALIKLRDAADVYAADQTNATDPRCGFVQPVTVAEADELNAALKKSNGILEEYQLAIKELIAAAERSVNKYQDSTCIYPACQCEACQLAVAINNIRK